MSTILQRTKIRYLTLRVSMSTGLYKVLDVLLPADVRNLTGISVNALRLIPDLTDGSVEYRAAGEVVLNGKSEGAFFRAFYDYNARNFDDAQDPESTRYFGDGFMPLSAGDNTRITGYVRDTSDDMPEFEPQSEYDLLITLRYESL
jgi:hypothetical protein